MFYNRKNKLEPSKAYTELIELECKLHLHKISVEYLLNRCDSNQLLANLL